MQKYLKVMCWVIVGVIIYLMYRSLPSNESNNIRKNEYLLNVVENYDFDPRKLVDLNNFRYLLDNAICRDHRDNDILGILIVTSYVGHDSQRSAHRTALPAEKLRSMNLLRIFLLAEIPSTERFITQGQVESEQILFKDLLQGNFVEAYRNLTYKHIMGLKWASVNCPNVKYIIKMDDDTVFDIFSLHNYLTNLSYQPQQYLLAGYVMSNKKAIRIRPSKWFVSRQEYERDKYPAYLSGWLYITNRKTAHDLVAESEYTKYFWIDDTYVTGLLAEQLRITHVNLNKWFSANSDFLDCCIKDMREHSLQCDYVVGPNYGDTKMIIEFTREVEKCYQNACFQRTPEDQMKNTCITKHKRIIQEHGVPLISEIKL